MKSSRLFAPGAGTGSRRSDGGRADASVRLDEAGYRMLATLEHAGGPEKALISAVHRARAEIAANPDLAEIPLAEVVSALASIADLPFLELEDEDDAADGAADRAADRAGSGPANLRLELTEPRRADKTRR